MSRSVVSCFSFQLARRSTGHRSISTSQTLAQQTRIGGGTSLLNERSLFHNAAIVSASFSSSPQAAASSPQAAAPRRSSLSSRSKKIIRIRSRSSRHKTRQGRSRKILSLVNSSDIEENKRSSKEKSKNSLDGVGSNRADFFPNETNNNQQELFSDTQTDPFASNYIKQALLRRLEESGEAWKTGRVSAFCTCEHYNHSSLTEALQKGGAVVTQPTIIREDPRMSRQIIHCLMDDPYKEPVNGKLQQADFFFFTSAGTMISWDASPTLNKEVREKILMQPKVQVEPYAKSLVDWEEEQFASVVTPSLDTKLEGDIIVIRKESYLRSFHEKLAFSHAMSYSSSLAMWENVVGKAVESLSPVPAQLAKGMRANTFREHQFMQTIGALLLLRYKINLIHDLKVIPDFYWERDHLGDLFQEMHKALKVPQRVDVLNSKINILQSLIELLRDSHIQTASHRVEWLIAILILVEIFIGLVGMYNKGDPHAVHSAQTAQQQGNKQAEARAGRAASRT
eukprot:g45318.t1